MIFLLFACFRPKYPYTGTEFFDSFVLEAIAIDTCFQEKIDVFHSHCQEMGSKMVALNGYFSCGDQNIGSLTLDNKLIGSQDPTGYAKLLCQKGERTLWYLLATYEDPELGIYPEPNPIDVF